MDIPTYQAGHQNSPKAERRELAVQLGSDIVSSLFDISRDHLSRPQSVHLQGATRFVMPVRLYPGALAIAVLAAARGYRSGSLDRGGAAAAALLGYSALANPLSVFGVCLLGFYLAGSRATKVRCRAACSA